MKGKILQKKFIILFSIISIVLIFLIGFISFNRRKNIPPRLGPIVEAVYALGTIKSYNVYNLKMAISTNIQKLHVTEGQDVKKGQLLLTNNDGTSFYSPFNGTVTKLFCNEDEMVVPGAVVLTIMDLGKKYIQVSLDQRSALLVKKRQKAQISVEILRGKTIEGTVESIYPSDGQFMARITAAQMPPEILPDMTADVAVEVAKRERALLIPLSSLRDGTVNVIRGGKKINVKIHIGVIDGEWGEVLDDALLHDDTIILDKKD